MQTYHIKIGKEKTRLKIIRDMEVVEEELTRYNTNKYLRDLLLRNDMPSNEELEKERREQELKREIKEEEERRKRLDELALKERSTSKYYQEFTIANLGHPIPIDMSKIADDSVPLDVAKEQIQRAYEDGMQDGQISARASFKSEIERYQAGIRKIDDFMADITEKFKAEIDRIENTFVDLAVMISEQILNKELEQDKNVVIYQVRKAISSVKGDTIFKIEINPKDYQLVKDSKAKIVEEFQLDDKIILHSNAAIPSGSCILVTSAGLIDARIKNQLKKVHEELTEEANRIFETHEIQSEMDKFFGEIKEDEIQKSLENELAEDEVDLEKLNYDDLPPEYREMFEDDIFGKEDMDLEGNIIEEEIIEEKEPEIAPDKIDYKKLYDDELNQSENEEIDEISSDEDENQFNSDLDFDFDDIFNDED